MATQTQKYRQAAIAYLIYGIVYLAGAVQLGLTGASARASGGLVFYLLGVVVLLLFPVLIWKEFKWFTRVLAIFVFYRIGGLLYVMLQDEGKMVPLVGGVEIRQFYGAVVFLLVTLTAFVFLVRAGFSKAEAGRVD